CSDSNPSAPRVPTSISASSASQSQIGVVGQALATPISVVVTDQSGAPIPNVSVIWSPSASSGSVSATTSLTDANGVAQVTWTLGTVAGVDSLNAKLAGGESTTITATANAATAASLSIVSGDNQDVAMGLTSAPLVVKVVDQYGNAVASAPVSW